MFRDIRSQKPENRRQKRASITAVRRAGPYDQPLRRPPGRNEAINGSRRKTQIPAPSLSSVFRLLTSETGFGLIAAIFAVVFLGLFGLLAAKHLQSTATGSAEARLWAQALYTADSTARLKILDHDGGGTGFVAPTIEGVNGSISSDTFTAPGAPAALESRGSIGSIVRKIQVKYIL